MDTQTRQTEGIETRNLNTKVLVIGLSFRLAFG